MTRSIAADVPLFTPPCFPASTAPPRSILDVREATISTARHLAERDCVPCRGGVPPLTPAEIEPLLAQLDGFEVVEDHHLRKRYRFADFSSALAFVNRVGALAEAVGHHPDLELGWGRVVLEIWTHKIDGLAEADFVFAARADRLVTDRRAAVRGGETQEEFR